MFAARRLALAGRSRRALSQQATPGSTKKPSAYGGGTGGPWLFGFGVGCATGMFVATSDAAPSNTAPQSGRVAVHTDRAPAAVGPYSQAIRDGKGTVFLSGQVGLVPGTTSLIEGGVRSQTRQALSNLRHVLEEAHSDVSLICKTTVLLHDITDYGAVNEEYAKFFAEHGHGACAPARAAFAVRDLPLGAKVEIEAVAIEK